MQANEGVPTGVQRIVRGAHTGPTELEDLLPGATSGDELPGKYPTKESIAASLQDVENVAADIERNAKAALVDSVREVSIGTEAIKSNLIGGISNQLDSVDNVARKLKSKLSSRIADGLTGVYADLVQMGIPVPSLEQVQYANATGDYLGSMLPLEGHPIEVTLPVPVEPPTDYTPIAPPSRPPQTPIQRPGMPPIATLPPPIRPVPVVPLPTTLPGTLPDGDDTGWEGGSGIGTMPLPPNWLGPIGPTEQCPTDTQGRPTGWRGETTFNGWTMPDFCGNCPPGTVNNGGSGTFFNACIPSGSGSQPPMQPPEQGQDLCPDGYYTFDWDGVSPLPVGAIRVGNRVCIPHPASVGEFCPADLAKNCGDKPVFPSVPSTPETGDYCHDIEQFLQSAVVNTPLIEHLIRGQYGSIGDSTIAKAVATAITGSNKPVIAALIDSLGKWLGEAAKAVVISPTCDKLALTPIASLHGIIKFINQWFGIVPKAATQTLQQAENLVCQTVMPDQPSTDKAYLSDTIDKELWRCWSELNGSVTKAAEIGLETLRTRPTSEQVSKLFRRDLITEDEFKKRMRQNGVIHDKDREAIHNLTQDWPSLSDLTPMLVRDVWDETTIDWAEVDKLFEAKYTKETKKYFDAIGLTKDVVKYYWRAHFHLPSFTMASEMYHRFRALPVGDPLRTDLDKVKALLIQDDWHPDWIDRMLAITFRPMRLIDIRTAYDMRILDDEGLKDKLRVLGYSDDDVTTTAKIWGKRREIRDAKQGGYPSVKSLIDKYANCEIDDHTFRLVLSYIVETPEQEMRAVEAAEVARTSEDNRRTIAGVSWQYRRGLISEEEATAELARQGIDPACIPSLVRVWKAQTSKQPKQLAAGSLCKMLEQGIISAPEFVNALLRIGYTSIDADRIVRSCAIGLTQKEIRKANQEAARLARERKAAEREAARLQRLAECGPPPCPKNRQTPSRNGEANPTNPAP